MLVTHQQLIRYTAAYEEDCPHIDYPTRLLWRCTATIALFFLFGFLLSFPVLAGVVVFLILYGGYYLGIFLRLLHILGVSRLKYSLCLLPLAGATYTIAMVLRAGFAQFIH